MIHTDERRKLEEKMMQPEDTLIAFNCCVSVPSECEDCPLFDGNRWDSARMEKCRKKLKNNVRYWLSNAEMLKP